MTTFKRNTFASWLLFVFIAVLALALAGCAEINEPAVDVADDANLEMLNNADGFGIELLEVSPEQTADWWQWFFGTQNQGEVCDENQPNDDVWYLAGTDLFPPSGKQPHKVKRECEIPSDKKILFPIINVLCGPNDPPAPVEDPEDPNNTILLPCIDFLVSNMEDLALKISTEDGTLKLKGSEDIQQVTYAFDCDESGENCQSISGGYWAFIKLSPGKYKVNFQGRLKFEDNEVYGSFNSALDVTYKLEVVE